MTKSIIHKTIPEPDGILGLGEDHIVVSVIKVRIGSCCYYHHKTCELWLIVLVLLGERNTREKEGEVIFEAK